MDYSVAVEVEKSISADYLDKLNVMKRSGLGIEVRLLKEMDTKLIFQITAENIVGIYYCGKSLGRLLGDQKTNLDSPVIPDLIIDSIKALKESIDKNFNTNNG